MTFRTDVARGAAAGGLALALLVGSPSSLFAQAAADVERASPEEALAAIKRRAERILKARKKAKRLQFYGQASEVIAYETNPGSAPHHKGDTSFEENLYLLLSKKLTQTITWQGSYYGLYLKYLDAGDLTYTSHTLTPVKLRWRPDRALRVESWMDLDYVYYPVGKNSTYRQLKWSGRIRNDFFERWYSQVQYEWFVRDYVTRNARNGAGNETLSNRVDVRSRLRHKVGLTVKEALPLKNARFTVENSYYSNDSNDNRSNFYDSQVWKITGAVRGDATENLSVRGSFAFERKNYDVRTVGGITAEARYDDKYTLKASGDYELDETWSLTSAVSFDHLGSNESSGEYDNMKYSLTVTARF